MPSILHFLCLYQEADKLASSRWKRLRCGSASWYWPDGEDAALGTEPKENRICRELGRSKRTWQQDRSSLPDTIHGDPSFPFAYIVTAYAQDDWIYYAWELIMPLALSRSHWAFIMHAKFCYFAHADEIWNSQTKNSKTNLQRREDWAQGHNSREDSTRKWHYLKIIEEVLSILSSDRVVQTFSAR